MVGPSSSLRSIAAGCREPDPKNARKAARDAWHSAGLILINPAWLTGWADRKQAEILAEKLFGKRKDLR